MWWTLHVMDIMWCILRCSSVFLDWIGREDNNARYWINYALCRPQCRLEDITVKLTGGGVELCTYILVMWLGPGWDQICGVCGSRKAKMSEYYGLHCSCSSSHVHVHVLIEGVHLTSFDRQTKHQCMTGVNLHHICRSSLAGAPAVLWTNFYCYHERYHVGEKPLRASRSA